MKKVMSPHDHGATGEKCLARLKSVGKISCAAFAVEWLVVGARRSNF
jgi:hypothetical protein